MKVMYLIPLIVFLAACGQGTGTGTSGGSNSDVSAQDSSAVSFSKTLGIGKSSRASVSFPASGVIVSALTERFVRNGGRPSFTPSGLTYLAITGKGKDRANDVLPSHDELMTQARDMVRIVQDGIATGKFSKTDLERSPADQVEAAKAGDVDQMAAALLRQQCLSIIVSFAQPLNGWPVNPMHRAEEKDVHRYIDFVTTGTEFSNQIITELASKVATNVWRDPDTAKAAVLREWDKLSPDMLYAAWNQARSQSATGVTIDLAGSKDVHWTSSSGDYIGNGNGWTVTRSGAPWFGNGYLSGREIVVGLESSINAMMQKGTDTSSSTGDKSGVNIGGKAQVQ